MSFYNFSCDGDHYSEARSRRPSVPSFDCLIPRPSLQPILGTAAQLAETALGADTVARVSALPLKAWKNE